MEVARGEVKAYGIFWMVLFVALIAYLAVLLTGCQAAPAKQFLPAVVVIPPKTFTLTFTTTASSLTASNVITTSTSPMGPWTPLASFPATGSDVSLVITQANGAHFFKVTNVWKLK